MSYNGQRPNGVRRSRRLRLLVVFGNTVERLTVRMECAAQGDCDDLIEVE